MAPRELAKWLRSSEEVQRASFLVRAVNMDNRKSVVEGYVFLNIQLPHCAWATYRGVLVSPPSISGFVSFWYASMLQNVDPQISRREMKLENVRRQRFTNRISRLKGLYCFLDKEDAKRTSCLWDGEHFTLDNLAEISLTEARSQDRLDSNWITFAPGLFSLRRVDAALLEWRAFSEQRAYLGNTC